MGYQKSAEEVGKNYVLAVQWRRTLDVKSVVVAGVCLLISEGLTIEGNLKLAFG